MKLQGLSVKRLFFYVIIGLILSMTVAAAILYYITEQAAVLAVGAVQILCALAWLLALHKYWERNSLSLPPIYAGP